ncbi:multiple sugar transport system permease protein [Microbacterium halimionae]|uniref:Multiple sugar transport system permease protein n=1 Tax=Microbacterium halimionae TaxID=1526413 RepID=A0A7W3JLY5_9MICO|nr:carbohydrate ABC transporter permease [Microbacterium halimionae]MBA8815134.1 multiple sugar transport system permease protein [Microbacterium halimionae]NII94075.1 multiple sugar transport system permease protein [Microbacterium halimionae]
MSAPAQSSTDHAPHTTVTGMPSRRNRGAGRPHGQRRIGSHVLLIILSLYFVIPIWWLLVASTKSTGGLFSSPAFWFDDPMSFFANIAGLFEHQGGIYWRWLGNSFLYAFAGGVGATIVAVLAGYGFAKYSFKGRGFVFGMILGSVMVPLTALVIPTFMLLSQYGLINTPWAVILPSLLNPFGVYLMRVYAQDAIPDELMEAARIDGAGEWRTFRTIVVPLLRPAIVTVLLLAVVTTWNNFFLPLAVLTDPNLLPVTVGLNRWLALSNAGAGGEQVWNLITSGAFISVVPLLLSFLFLQRYWQGGLAIGAVK